MKKHLRVITAIVTLFMTVGVLAGCGGEASPPPASETPAGEATPAPTSSEKISVRVGQTSDVLSFDPHDQSDMGSATVIRHIYDTLFFLTPTDDIVPGLAESWEAENDTTLVVHVRQGVKFHNGDPLTSADIKFSLERQKTLPKQQTPVLDLDHVEIVDEYTCKLVLNQPVTACIVNSLTHVGASIVPKNHTEKVEGEGKTLNENPIGTGRYKYVSFNAYDKTVLEKNTEYWGSPTLNDELVIVVLPDASSRTIALETGDIDILQNVDPVDVARLESNANTVVDRYSSTWQEFLVPNNEKAPFDNVLVRQAIAHLIDRDSIVAVAEEGHATPLFSPIAEGATGYSPDVKHYDYNIDAAKALLAEAGYPDGFETTIYLFADNRLRTATLLQEIFEQAGIKLNVESMERGAFYDMTGRGDHELALSGWISDAEPDTTFTSLYATASKGDTGNRFFYSSATVDELLQQAKQETDQAGRQALYTKVQQEVINDCGAIPLYTMEGTIGSRTNVEGLLIYATGQHMFHEVTFK